MSDTGVVRVEPNDEGSTLKTRDWETGVSVPCL